jgi:hypothetical protein
MIQFPRTVFALLLAGGILRAANPSFDPHWFVGQSFQVRYDFQLGLDPKTTAGPQQVPGSATYTYTVASLGVEAGHNVAKISVVPNDAGWSQWLLTFDTTAVALLKVEEVIPSGNSVYTNPFGADAWLTKLGEFRFSLIQDFPRIPDNLVNESRVISAAGSSTPPFTQQITFVGSSSVTALLSRTDAKTGLLQQATIRWESSRPWWWTSAEVLLGSTSKVSGTLLP